jgi:hemoglobin
MMEDRPTIYQQVGGMETFVTIGREFYERVAADPVLRPLYPESLDAPRDHLTLFLVQFFGGPQNYSLQRGHPMLRARHLPFKIGVRERDAWVKNMLEALECVDMPEGPREEMREYFQRAATFLINQLE